MHLRTFTTLLLACAPALFAPLAEAAPLVAHRAVYDVELKRNDRDSGYSDVTGRLAYEITGSKCEGWSINYRFASRYDQSEGSVQVTDSQFTSWEAGDGTELRVNQKYFVDNTLSSENKVVVKRETPDGIAKGDVNLPEMKNFELSADTLFPVIYQSKLLDDAASGKKRSSELVYEGTESDKFYRVVSFIAKPVHNANLVSDPNLKPLSNLAAWRMTTSYFETGSDASEAPIYQSSYTMYENGVSTDLVLDYGKYALSGKLAKLDMIESAPCD